ncbi:MAG: hypothetical protein ACFFCF_08135 [Promethearchaeota archaeon]
MKYSEFLQAHKDLMTQSKMSGVEHEDERVLPIYETDWVQVIFAQLPQRSASCKIIVEVSFPTWVHDLSVTGAANDQSPNHTPQLQKVLRDQIRHLEYLLKLSHAGFRLAIIAEEGVWNAWTVVEDPPSQDLFLLLSPPEPTL